jgi:hypothetical protein
VTKKNEKKLNKTNKKTTKYGKEPLIKTQKSTMASMTK